MPTGVPRLPEPHEWMVMKVCTICWERKPCAKFGAAVYAEDGSIRYYSSYCNDCKAERGRRRKDAWVEQNRDHVRAYNREWQRERRARLRQEKMLRMETLPKGPFVAWLEKQVELFDGLDPVAQCIGISERTLRRIMVEQDRVSLVTVDKCCVALGFHIYDLYPELAEEAA